MENLIGSFFYWFIMATKIFFSLCGQTLTWWAAGIPITMTTGRTATLNSTSATMDQGKKKILFTQQNISYPFNSKLGMNPYS